MLNKIFAGVMAASGLLTLTMLYAAFAPAACGAVHLRRNDPTARLPQSIVPNWGVLIGLMGALLIYGALHAPSRKLALLSSPALARVAFVALILAQGERYLSGLGAVIIVDSVMVVLFAAYVIFGKPTAP
jgi:hypothetical protein